MNCHPPLSPPKRILVISSTFPRWKDDKDPPFVFELCRRLLRNFRVQILAPHAPGAKTREELEGLQVYRFRYFLERGEVLAYGSHPGGGGILANLKRQPWSYALVPFFLATELLSLVRLLRGQRFDLIHAHWLIPQGLMAVLAARISRSEVPLVCTSHGADLFALRGAVWERLKKHVLASSSGITVVSRTMRERLISMSDKHDKIRVIPMGVDLERQFVPLAGRRRSKSLLFVGRMVEKKGLRYLIEAMPMVVDKHPEARLVIAGSGPEEAPMRRLVRALSLEEHVEFVGALENREIPALYQASELVVFPSVVAKDGDQEGFGLVLVEALGCECAVIATDLPAIRDIVVDGETGLIVPEKDPVALAQKITYLLDNPRVLSSLAKDGRIFVLKRYDWRNITAQYETFFLELMEMGEH
jgi:glycosyltransferase involved in cell wall biosynthesis